MHIPSAELMSILTRFNPWRRGALLDLPLWSRAVFKELYQWAAQPPAKRAVMLLGARQVGKTTLLHQLVRKLLDDGVSASNILYITMDHPLLKMAGLDAAIEAWREMEPSAGGQEFVFVDEIQSVKDWDVWVKLQVDFQKERRIFFTGSALPLADAVQESGVGRWHICKLHTLSFYEYLHIKKISLPPLPALPSLLSLFSWGTSAFHGCTAQAESYVGHFHEYLLRGGFPQTALVEDIDQAQRLVREDIIDKVLNRDITVFYGVRRVLDLESTFLYLCMNSGGLLDMTNLSKEIGVKRPTAESYIELLESVHLLFRLRPYGYGKEVLRGRFKIYLADPSMAPAVLLQGKSLLEDSVALGQAVESAVCKHLAGRYYRQNMQFSYWKNKKNQEVDFVGALGADVTPFEVKYRETHTQSSDLPGLKDFMQSRKCKRGYVITKSLSDFGLLSSLSADQAPIMKIPAPLFCYWMGENELQNFAM